MIYEGTKVKVDEYNFNHIYGKETMQKLVWEVIAVNTPTKSHPVTTYVCTCKEFKQGTPMVFIEKNLVVC